MNEILAARENFSDDAPRIGRKARLERYRLLFRVSERTKSYQNDEASYYQRYLYRYFRGRAVRISRPHFVHTTRGDCYASFYIAATNVGDRAGKTFLFDNDNFLELDEKKLQNFGLDKMRKSYTTGDVMEQQNVKLRRKLALRKRANKNR